MGEETPAGDALATMQSAILETVRVLLVEDHADTREIATSVLASRGAHVVAVVTAQEAMDYLQSETVDVIVCDLRLPHVPGYNLIRSLRKLPPERGGRTPAIAFTAYASAQDERVAMASGFDAYVGKPRIYDLPRIVASMLPRR